MGEEGEWVDETPLAREAPRDYVLRLARAKAEAGWRRREALALPYPGVLPEGPAKKKAFGAD